MSGDYSASLFKTPFGMGAVIIREKVLYSVTLPDPNSGMPQGTEPELALLSSSPLSERVAHLLQRYFAGENVAFDLPLSFAGKTGFQQAVLNVVTAIPYGSIMTYGEVARKSGSPRGARGVGSVMASNTLPIVIPCHRVVGVTGEMTGYTAPGGLELKRWLLELEGIEVDSRGRVKK